MDPRINHENLSHYIELHLHRNASGGFDGLRPRSDSRPKRSLASDWMSPPALLRYHYNNNFPYQHDN